MAYNKTTWIDDVTPLDAEHLNNMEDGIEKMYKATVNGKTLSDNPILTAADVGALPASTKIPIIDKKFSSTSENAQSGIAVAEAIAQNTYTKISKIEISVDDFSQFDTSKVYIAANDIQVKYKKTSTAEFTTIDESTIYKNSLITFSSWIDTEYSTPEFLIIVSGRIISDNFVYCNAKYQFEDEVEGERFLAYEPLYFNPSPTDLRYFATSDNPQSGKAVAEAVSTEQNRADNTFSNALKGSKSGSAILIDDVSLVTHEMSVKVRSKNLLPYPYNQSSQSHDGATITVNEDRSINFSGTPTAYIGIVLYKGNALVKSGTFTISVGNLTNVDTSLFIYDSSGATLYTIRTNENITVNADDYPTAATWNISMQRSASNTEMDGTAYPQIELGTTATDYTPYVPDLTAVKVSRCGKNLLSAMSLFPTITNNAVPIHFKAGQKYTISFTTTYTAWRFMFFGTDKNGTVFDASSPNINKYISETYTGATGRLQLSGNRTGNTFIFTCNEDCIITAIVFWNAANETDKTYSDFQLELGTTATDYEPYIGAEYKPDSDGTVNGVTSLYPNATLMTDTDGVIIDCEYNRDINKAFAALEAAIATNNS